MIIRTARENDIESITAIHNHAVQHTTAIWKDTTVEPADRASWMEEHHRAGYPVLVAVDDADNVLGYATFGEWRALEGYRHTVEHSVYVQVDQRGKGVGRALMIETIRQARLLGKHVMVAAVESGNIGSITLHERLGFIRVGHLPQVGTKFGRWLDLTLLQLILDEHPESDVTTLP